MNPLSGSSSRKPSRVRETHPRLLHGDRVFHRPAARTRDQETIGQGVGEGDRTRGMTQRRQSSTIRRSNIDLDRFRPVGGELGVGPLDDLADGVLEGGGIVDLDDQLPGREGRIGPSTAKVPSPPMATARSFAEIDPDLAFEALEFAERIRTELGDHAEEFVKELDHRPWRRRPTPDRRPGRQSPGSPAAPVRRARPRHRGGGR